MPITEYRGAGCRTRATVVTLSVHEAAETVRRRRGRRRMEKRISRVAVLRSEGSRFEGPADPAALAGLDAEGRER